MRQEDSLLERLLEFYEAYFDIQRPFAAGGVRCDAYAFCNMSNERYVLVKSAQLWQANVYEHVFFREVDELSQREFEQWRRWLRERIEPEFARKGQKYPEAGHMCTYLTTIFICQSAVDEKRIRRIRRHKFHVNYRFALRGYCKSALAVFDLETGRIYGNGPARRLVKKYKHIFDISVQGG